MSAVNLWLMDNVKHGTAFIRSLTRHAPDWQRTTKAIGGWWIGDFTITTATMTPVQMDKAFKSWLNHRIVEKTYSITSWAGYIARMELVQKGVTYRRDLDPEVWHNRVKVKYRHPVSEDLEQGNLTYNPVGNSFQDDAQDFSDWETLAGNAVYEIEITNDDASTISGFLGASFTTATANDSIYVYQDIGLATAGWSSNPGGKTPSSYVVRNVLLYGTTQETSWIESTSSQAEYGTQNYLDVIGESLATPATQAAYRRISENAWPRSRPVAGLESSRTRIIEQDSLRIYVLGYVHTINWKYQAADLPSTTITAQLIDLVNRSEFVNAGSIDSNAMKQFIEAARIEQRRWDTIEDLILAGDASNNRWVGGVYQGRKLHYHLAESKITHVWRNGRLLTKSGRPIEPSLIKPDIIVRVEGGGPLGAKAPGGNLWSKAKNVWIEAVEFSMPDEYRLIPYEG